MVKKLAARGLVDHQPYRGVRLTRRGERLALEVLRHHRLLELYLARTLELELDAVHAEADRLEHALSETLEERIDKALGSPTEDPHGDPIPDAALKIVQPTARRLTELEPGERATVQGVPDGDGEVLRYLAELGPRARAAGRARARRAVRRPDHGARRPPRRHLAPARSRDPHRA